MGYVRRSCPSGGWGVASPLRNVYPSILRGDESLLFFRLPVSAVWEAAHAWPRDRRRRARASGYPGRSTCTLARLLGWTPEIAPMTRAPSPRTVRWGNGRQTPRLLFAAAWKARNGSSRLARRPARSPALPTDTLRGGRRDSRTRRTAAATSAAGTPFASSRSMRPTALATAAP